MITSRITISNSLGLHARASMKLHDLANRFQSKIQLHVAGNCVDAKDILSLMSLAASKGTNLTLTCDGPDEKQAANSIIELINRRFDEE